MSQDTIKSAGNLGYIGSILMLIPVIDIIGAILVLIALRRLSKVYGNERIWRNALYGVIVIPIASAMAIAILIRSLYFSVSAAIFIIVAFFLSIILSNWFMKNAYSELGKSSGVSNFNNASYWYKLAAFLSIIIIGLIFSLIANIYAILGFRKLRG